MHPRFLFHVTPLMCRVRGGLINVMVEDPAPPFNLKPLEVCAEESDFRVFTEINLID